MKPHAIRKLLTAALALTACLLWPGQAEARFGKSGSSSSSSSSSGSHSSGSHSHSASPVNSSGSGGGSGGSTYTPGPGLYRSGYGYAPSYSCWDDPLCPRYAWGFGYRPFFYRPYSSYPSYYVAPTGAARLEQEQRSGVATVTADAMGYTSGGVGVGIGMAFESSSRWGFEARYNGIFVPSQDGSTVTDAIHMLDAHLTYALLSGESGKLRVGIGADSAFAPDVIFLGPGLTASGALGLMGPLGIDGQITVVPFPFVKVDWSAGLSLGWGPLGVRAGWRHIYLDDRGWVDGVAHQDLFNGPYVGLGLAM